MTHEKIFNRPDGYMLKVICSASYFFTQQKTAYKYTFDIYKKLPKRKKWSQVIYLREWILSDARFKQQQEEVKQLISYEELFEIKMELWNSFKPCIII
jgi:hypothetical protein